ncbi:tetratricopeptide repeat protein [Dyella flagellata]|uniref:Sel1 repeat family protein n=1 Tax=Dyella flagellata TaxID=1867833 RepID=A0ABQ5XI77_9GAMM|nr:tetratricopeptide repeat protein [Dyella flagellata]GLQ90238.1 hypothetical protein GCM10007898_38130 [Dyella flagellata]
MKVWVFLLAMLCLGDACAADFMEGVYALGRHDYAAAFAVFMPLAQNGDTSAQLKLGTMYQYGYGVPVDNHSAFEWYQKAAMQGDPDGEVDLGLMYQRGLGTRRDAAKAVEWFRRAEDRQWSRAELQLAIAYERGLGVRPDHAQAMEWLNKSLRQHYPKAQAYAGYLAFTGQGAPRDLNRALTLFRLAGSSVDEFAEGDFYLAKMYFEGDGVAKDYVVADVLSIAACKGQENDPVLPMQPEKLRQQIEGRMSRSQLADSKDLWRSAYHRGLIDAIDDRAYALTGASFKGSEDPLLNAVVDVVFVEIHRSGEVLFNGRVIDEPSLQERIQMLFHMSSRPKLKLIIDGDASQPRVNQAVEMVMSYLKQLGWRNFEVEKR